MNTSLSHKKSSDAISSVKFDRLPAFASFILENELDNLVGLQIQFSKEEDLPLLKLLKGLSENELFAAAKDGAIKLLNSLVEGNVQEYIRDNAKNYKENLIPFFERESVLMEDICLVSFIRRKAFRRLVHIYTNDILLQEQIMEELDRFLNASEQASFNVLIEINEEKLKKANSEISLKHKELVEAQELAEMGSFVWDIQSGNSDFTKGIQDILEIKEPISLEKFIAHVHKNDRRDLLAKLHRSLNGELFNCEFRYLVNNNMKYLWSRGIVSSGKDGRQFMKGTIMDISQKRFMLEKLQKSEEMNKQAQAITHIGNWSWNIESNIVEWSDELYRIYGLEPQSEQITIEKYFSFIHPDDRKKRKNDIDESLRTLKAKDYHLKIISADKKIKILKGKGEVLLDNNKMPHSMVGTCQDITVEYNLSKEIQEKEEYLHQLIKNAPDAILVTDESGMINLWNPKSEKLFGWKEKEIIGEKFIDKIISPDNQPQKKKIEKIFKSKSKLSQNADILTVNKKGKNIHASFTISQFVQKGRALFIIFIRDITKEKNTSSELLAKSSELEKLIASLELKNFELITANKELESFNYIASHDLQEPLRKIQTFASRIIEDDKFVLPKNIGGYINKIVDSSLRMKTLINDILRFSQSTQQEGNFEAIDLNIVLEEVKDSLSASIERKNAKIDSAALPIVNGIHFQIHQLLLNILGNALKYSKETISPLIEISADTVKGSHIKLPMAVKEINYFKISIKDNGIGFDKEHSNKVFELFQRLHNNAYYSGTGIGLAICKKIVHKHKGFITANSSLNKGSTFQIYLPAS